MLNKIAAGLLCVGVLISTPSLAINHTISPSLKLEYELKSNEPLSLKNPLPITIEAKCTVKTENPASIYINLISGSSKINDVDMKVGEKITLAVVDNSKINITADHKAEVILTNTGEHSIKLSCTN